MKRAGWLACAAMALAVPGWTSELRVRSSGPEGELSSLEQADEVRVVFAEPMVVLGRIPDPVTAPFFTISPDVKGSFRWAGTDTLIFKPDAPLPYATRYTVTVATSATSVAGNRLPAPHSFSFTTPTVKLLHTNWYRKTRRADSPLVVVLRFNQPVAPLEVSKHLSLRYEPHPWKAPELPAGTRDRMQAIDPQSVADFEAKVARTQAAARSRAVVQYVNAVDWDQKAFPASPDLIVLETRTGPPTDAWIKIWLDGRVPAAGGAESGRETQEYTLKLEPTLFVDGLVCSAACDPEAYNPLRLRASVAPRQLRGVLSVWDVTDPAQEKLQKPRKPQQADEEEEDTEPESYEDTEYEYDQSSSIDVEYVGYPLKPARTYALAVSRTLRSRDGQTLGYTWVGTLENWRQNAFSSFGDGHGVWEAGGGPILPFHARNLQSVSQWADPLEPDELMPAVRRLQDEQETRSKEPAPPQATARKLRPRPDALQSYGLDLNALLSPGGTGLAWAGLVDGPPIPKARPADSARRHDTIVQVTNLGISVKDSPANTLILVTRLSDGAPVQGATVTIRGLDNRVVWTGPTDARGLAEAPDTDLRNRELWPRFHFLVTAEKDGDVAYVGSDWNEGIEPWMFDTPVNLSEAEPILRGGVFTDRGVYKLGEEVHFKAVLRHDTTKGIALLPAGTTVEVALRDSHGDERDKRTIAISEWSSGEWTFTLPDEAPLGHYSVTAKLPGRDRDVTGSFLVAAYRRPDFRVDTNLAGETSLAGVTLKGIVNGQYLFGAPMASRDVRWTYSRQPIDTVPAKILDRFPSDRYAFMNEDWDSREYRPAETVSTKSGTLDAAGQLALDLETKKDAGLAWQYVLEGEVTDVTRQTIAGRASFRVDPAPWYIGLKRPPYFGDAGKGIDTEVVAVDLAGAPAAGVQVQVTVTQIQWNSVRRAEGGGFYTWDTERKEVPAGEWDVTTTESPAPLHAPLGTGGYFVLRATARDSEGRATTTAIGFYALGEGYTAWRRYDHNRIDLVPERGTYKPGDTARLMVKSPWETATALLTTEREGIRSYETFALTSTQQMVSVPIGEKDIPNVFVSVLLVKGRTANFTGEDTSDPGKPAFRLGYAQLKVEDASRRLQVAVKSDREEYRPASKARVDVTVTDASGKPAASEVTLWAVDYGVLSLTNYRTPDLLGSVYMEKALQVMNEDSRQRIISRRVLTPKGGDEGGGGGREEGAETQVRKDFRVLAFWLGSLPTDAQGRATTDVTLPESLTTYRIMAVAADRESRFGRGEREIRISKPVLIRPAFPRFLTKGDRAFFGASVTSQLKESGAAIVTLRSLDPSILALEGNSKRTITIGAKATQEVRFTLRALASGRARVQMSVKLFGETDAFEEALPVTVVVSPEVVAAYGSTQDKAVEALELPAGVDPTRGGLRLELSSTALVGLGEGARYLVTYPYGCAEQRASAALALMLAADLGDAFSLPDIQPGQLKASAAATLKDLESFQCENGGFAYWKGGCQSPQPYLTSYVLHVLGRGRSLGYAVPATVTDGGLAFLEKELGNERPANEGWWPAYTAWQAFAVKVLAEGGRNVDSHLTRLHGYRERMPVFALGYLRDALHAKGEEGERATELDRRILNAILPEGGTAHVEELSDPYLLWFWNSNVRSTAITLGSLVRANADPALEPRVVRWLLQARQRGRWGNTQENAWAMEALVDYYRARETEIPDFTAVVSLAKDTLAQARFQGRSTEPQVRDVPQAELLKKGRPGERMELGFARQGIGTLHYGARLTYVPSASDLQPLDQGFAVERSYEPAKTEQSPGTRFAAGELVRVTLHFRIPKERRYVAVVDPLPAGFEPVDNAFATTAQGLSQQAETQDSVRWEDWWQRGGFDHVERHDDRVQLFATRLAEGEHTFTYLARATTSGTFQVAPTRAEEMYSPEVFGRTGSVVVEVAQ